MESLASLAAEPAASVASVVMSIQVFGRQVTTDTATRQIAVEDYVITRKQIASFDLPEWTDEVLAPRLPP